MRGTYRPSCKRLRGSASRRLRKRHAPTHVNAEVQILKDASAYFGLGGGSEFEAYTLSSSRLGDDDACCVPAFSSAA